MDDVSKKVCLYVKKYDGTIKKYKIRVRGQNISKNCLWTKTIYKS